jgi:hypothetical protein
VEEEFDRARPVLEAVGAKSELELILSLVVVADDDEEKWLLEQLADALRD